jgi:hypothetical protein
VALSRLKLEFESPWGHKCRRKAVFVFKPRTVRSGANILSQHGDGQGEKLTVEAWNGFTSKYCVFSNVWEDGGYVGAMLPAHPPFSFLLRRYQISRDMKFNNLLHILA